MIELYSAATFNGQRVTIMLEETGVSYTPHWVNLARGEQHQDAFLALNPSGRIPVLVKRDNDRSPPLVITQSTAILQFLAEQTGQFLPQSLSARIKVYEWMHFHAIDIGSVMFTAFYLKRRCTPQQIQASELLSRRIHELYSFFDQQLAKQPFLAGSEYSIADITAFPAVFSLRQSLTDYPNLMRWMQQLNQRPAVQRGMSIPEKEAGHAD